MDNIAKEFRTNGYAVIENFLSDIEVDELKMEMNNIVQRETRKAHKSIFTTVGDQKNFMDEYFLTSGDKIRTFYEESAFDETGQLSISKDKAINKVGHALHKLSPPFRKATFSEKTKEILKIIGLVRPVVTQTMYIFKQPKIGGEVAGHQDGTYLSTTPMNGIGFWIALDDADLENGCLHFIRKSHTNGLVNNYKLVRTQTDEGIRCVYVGTASAYNLKDFVPVPAKSGTLILIDALVVHRSARNTSDKSRNAFTIHFYDKAVAKWHENNWIQPTSEENFEEIYNNEC